MVERRSAAWDLAGVHDPAAGLDLARGLALLGLIAAGVFHAAPGNGPSALGPMSAGDCPAVTFSIVMGASLALASGGSRIPGRRHRASARAELVVQAVLIAVIGLALGFCRSVPVVLTYYGVLCLVTTLFLARRPWFLVRIAAVILLVVPIVITSTVDHIHRPEGNPDFSSLVTHPTGMAVDVFITGFYPVLANLACTCAGLAIGRLDLLSSVQLIRKLLLSGLALVAFSWVSWLALPAVRSHGWVYLIRSINSLGTAVVVLVAALYLVRASLTERLLRPLTTAGTMALTLYCTYVLLLATGVLGNKPVEQYPVILIVALLFAVVWRRFIPDGPLEWLIAQVSQRARDAVLTPATQPSE